MNNIFNRHETIFEYNDKSATNCQLTVAVSLYNYENYILDCLNSIRSQTLLDIELIVVDDLSQDKSVEIVYKWLSENSHYFSRTLLLKHRFNRGVAFTRNTAIFKATTPYVFILDADDTLKPRALEKVLFTIINSNADACYSQIALFGEIDDLCTNDYFLIDLIKTKSYISSTAIFKRDSLIEFGGYSHIEGGWEYYDMWCNFVEKNKKIIFIPDILFNQRIHNNAMSKNATENIIEDVSVQLLIRHPWLRINKDFYKKRINKVK